MGKCIVFDFDGVIIDSHEVQKKALKESFQNVFGDKEPPYDAFFEMSGDSLPNIFVMLGIPLTVLPIYKKNSEENMGMIRVYTGIIPMLEMLNNKGIKCALCTGKDRSRTLDILHIMHLDRFFCKVVCSDDVKNPKPYPDSLLKIIDELEIMKNDVVMVGDGINDILCAKAAGTKSIAVTWGEVRKDKLLAMEPNAIVDTVQELCKQICKMLCMEQCLRESL